MSEEQLKRRNEPMAKWQELILKMIEEIDLHIKRNDPETLSLHYLSEKSGYSEFHLSKSSGKFRECSSGIICDIGD